MTLSRKRGCFAAGADCDLGPWGRLQEHHVVKQQRIRSVHARLLKAFRRGIGPRPWSLRKALEDPRVLVTTCWRHHLPLETGELVSVPPGFWSYIEEFEGLEAELPRHLWEAWAEIRSEAA